jgi:hypothetical protein
MKLALHVIHNHFCDMAHSHNAQIRCLIELETKDTEILRKLRQDNTCEKL